MIALSSVLNCKVWFQLLSHHLRSNDERVPSFDFLFIDTVGLRKFSCPDVGNWTRAFFPPPALSPLSRFLQRRCLPEVLDPAPDKFQVKPSSPFCHHASIKNKNKRKLYS